MENNLIDSAFGQRHLAGLHLRLPFGPDGNPALRLWWARGVLLHQEGVSKDGEEYTHLQVADVDERGKAYDLRVNDIGGDFAEGDAVSIFGHVSFAARADEFPKIIHNHNTNRWFAVFPLPYHSGGNPLILMTKQGDWLFWKGEVLVDEQQRRGFFSWGGCVGIFFATYLLGYTIHWWTIPVVGGATCYAYWRKKYLRVKRARVWLQPIYQEVSSRMQAWAMQNPDEPAHWVVQPRYKVG